MDDGIEQNPAYGTARTLDLQGNTNPKLSRDGLKDNGGPTRTIALQKSSPALNAIPSDTNECGTTVKTDQRGVERPQGTGCDIGAYEMKVRLR